MQDANSIKVRKLPTRSLVLHDEIAIDRSCETVWPALFEYNQWNPQHIGAKVARIAGKPNQEGDTLVEQQKAGAGFAPPIVIEIIKLVPSRKVVWKMYEPHDPPEVLAVSFVDFSLESLGSKTRFVYNSYTEILEQKFAQFPSTESYQQLMAEAFGALKRYVETRK